MQYWLLFYSWFFFSYMILMYIRDKNQHSFFRHSFLAIRQTARRKNIIMTDSYPLHEVYISNGNKVSAHQDKRSSFDKSFVDLENFFTTKRRIVIKWVKRRGQGLANNLRSIRGILLLAIANNASVCIDYDNYLSVMNEKLIILKCQTSQKYEFWTQNMIMSWIKREQCNYYLHNNTSIATCYDVSYYFSHCSNFIADISGHIDYINIKHYLEYISSFIFQPKEYIVEYANSVLLSMKGIKIGIQLRFGGEFAVSKEGGKFLNPDRFDLVLSQLTQIFKDIRKPFSVFVSSDSQSAPDMLKPLNQSLITAAKYNIGHSGRSATMDRAVTDIYILSRCDVLIYTFRSSYGRFARDISKSDRIFVLKTYYVCTIILWL